MAENFIRGVGFSQLNNQRWTSTAGLSTTVEHTGTYQELSAISQRAQNCGYREASFARVGDGKKVWKLRLTYIGRNPETITGGRAQIELQSNHWLASNRLDNLPLWKHPHYAPLLNINVKAVQRQWRATTEGQEFVSYDHAVATYTGVQPNFRIIQFSETYPYSSLLQTLAEAWRSAITQQFNLLFRNVLLKIPPVTIDFATKEQIGFVNLTEPFNVRKHFVTRLPPTLLGDTPFGADDYFNLLPVKSNGKEDTEKIDMAQRFANNILARRDTQQYNRVIISNDWVVSELGITGESYKGVNEVWASQDIIDLINDQINDRRKDRRGTPAECINIDATFEEVVKALQGKLSDRAWVKRMPTIRQVGQGRLQLHNEWESRLPIEINKDIISPYSSTAAKLIGTRARVV